MQQLDNLLLQQVLANQLKINLFSSSQAPSSTDLKLVKRNSDANEESEDMYNSTSCHSEPKSQSTQETQIISQIQKKEEIFKKRKISEEKCQKIEWYIEENDNVLNWRDESDSEDSVNNIDNIRTNKNNNSNINNNHIKIEDNETQETNINKLDEQNQQKNKIQQKQQFKFENLVKTLENFDEYCQNSQNNQQINKKCNKYPLDEGKEYFVQKSDQYECHHENCKFQSKIYQTLYSHYRRKHQTLLKIQTKNNI